MSDREGSPQAYVMPAGGGTPRQVTFHTAGCSVLGWYPDGQSLLVEASRDHYWRHAERLVRISTRERQAEEVLFDDYGQNGCLSPDGKRLLFTREGPAWWRKGYHGSQSSQIWLYDIESKTFTKLLDHERGCLWPLWKPDGVSFYYVGGQSGSFNLREFNIETRKDTQLTRFTDDSVVFPCVSRDGSTLVFRHLFDLCSFKPASGSEPSKIEVLHDGDRASARQERRILDRATDVAFTHDGLETAFIAGGDLWVMDTELREPRQITATPEEESHPVFSPDGDSILFISDMNGKNEIWRAQRADKQKYWFQNHAFKIDRITNDGEAKSALSFSPDGSHIAYVRGRGDLWVSNADGMSAKLLIPSWNAPDYDWSPDGKWLAYAIEDQDFNRDIWLIPSDGSGKPFNLSRHPFNEHRPVWSPDGKAIAFTGQRAGGGNEANICFVWLRAEDEEKDTRERSLEKALEKLNKVRKPGAKKLDTGSGAKGSGSKEDSEEKEEPKGSTSKRTPSVTIDFDRIHERIHRIALPEGAANNLTWSPESNKLAFTATIEGKAGTYTVDIPDDLKPKLLTTQTGTHVHWLKQGNQLVWLSGGVPASYPVGPGSPRAGTGPSSAPPTGGAAPRAGTTDTAGGGTPYRFQALQIVEIGKKNAAAFDLCWRTMRDNWYDERMGNRDWNAVRTKYLEMAGEVPDAEGLSTVVNLMLGELNGSHLGFFAGSSTLPARRGPAATPEASPGTWTEMTAHLGLRFAPDFKGPGLKVRDVLPDGPTDHKKSKVEAGEIVLAIDGTSVDPAMDLTRVLNGPLGRDIVLKVRNAAGKEREVTVRPITYPAARNLLYRRWIEENRKMVDEASKGMLGYLHIAAMDMASFQKFEEELYSIAAGKDGLVIDVRENGGGSTTDHLLTALTQPVHAITVPRGGGQGYPQDRKVYTTWSKPIVVLCNQNSFSNAEIFSHAIKTLKRGQLVGVPTAGGVISAGGTAIMDVGFLRLPTRGWYGISDGQDMELHGAVPDLIVWPQPGDLPSGKDVQLSKAVEVLQGDVQKWKDRPRPELKKATER